MNKLNSAIDRIKVLITSSRRFVPGALVMALFQLPFAPLASTPISIRSFTVAPAPKTASVTAMPSVISLEQQFFGHISSESQEKIDDEVAFVSSRNAFPASLDVIKKHAATIEETARAKNVPEDVALGVALLENGGSETAVSSAGALGVFQLMPGTARNLGLTVTKTVDDRKDPKQNIEAGITYLAANYERFGDWGLATWAYHAGEGNVLKALKIYAKTHDGIELPGIANVDVAREYVESHDITVHKLLSDPAVQKFTKKLNDDSAGYPYKVVATAKLFRSAENSF